MAGLVGGLGLAPGANIGADAAIFEAVHGSAPDIAGKGIANPVSLLLAAGLMLEHVGRLDLAQKLRRAIDAAIVKRQCPHRRYGRQGRHARFCRGDRESHFGIGLLSRAVAASPVFARYPAGKSCA